MAYFLQYSFSLLPISNCEVYILKRRFGKQVHFNRKDLKLPQA